MNEKTLKYIIGKNSIVNAAKDSDKDGVMDIIDCDPKDPNKQGWIHDKIKQWTKERSERKVQEAEFKRQAQEAGEQKYATERAKYLKERAEKSATARARTPGVGESILQGIKGFSSGVSRPSSSSVSKRRKVTTYVKKGKHYVKRTKYVNKPINTTDRNRDGIPDIFGVRSDRNRDGKIDVLGLNRKKGKQPSIFNMRFY